MLLTAGERISMALLAMAIANLGHRAKSFTGSQAGVITDSAHGRAKIIDITPGRIEQALGGRATSRSSPASRASRWRRRTSPRSAGAPPTRRPSRLAAALDAEICEIYSDVDGIFTADPRIVPMARRIPRISYEEMLEMCASGAKILHLRCVEYARRYAMPIHVRSSFSTKPGTWVGSLTEGDAVEQAIIAGVAHDRSEAKITVVGVPDKVGEAARIFETLGWVRHQHRHDRAEHLGLRDRPHRHLVHAAARGRQLAMESLSSLQDEVGFERLLYDDRIGKVSLVGAGMRTHPGVTAKFFGALASVGVNIEMISTSEIRISVIVERGSRGHRGGRRPQGLRPRCNRR